MFSVGFQLLLGSLIAKQWRLKKIFLSRTLRVSYVSELWLFLLVVALCAIDTAIVSCSLIVDTPVVGQAYVDGLLTAPHCDQVSEEARGRGERRERGRRERDR